MIVPAETEDASDRRPGAAPDVHPDPGPRTGPATSARDAVSGTCPYLTSSGGSWRMAAPSRDHRCAAVEPAASQTTDKQRRHCLSRDHVECSTFRAARLARTSSLAGTVDPELIDAADHRRRPLARPAPILLEPPRFVDKAVHLQFDRAPGQLALVALMVVAFAIVALTRFSGGGGSTASPSPAPSAAIPSQSPTPQPTPSAVPASSGPSPSSSAGPLPSPRTTYRVKKGDTLLAIASHFGTTAAKIRQLNGLTSNVLKIGQVLKIP